MNRSIESMSRIEVIRRVQGGDEFIMRAKALAREIFKGIDSDMPGALLEVSDPNIMGPDRPQIVRIQEEPFSIYNPNNLRLNLYQRQALPERYLSNKFYGARAALRDGKLNRVAKKSGASQDSKIEPINKTLFQIQLKYDFPNESRVGIECDTVSCRYSDEVDSNAVELTLPLKLSSRSTQMLIEQSKVCASTMKQYYPTVAYPDTPQHVEVPFARLRSEQRSDRQLKQIETFIKAIRKDLLPQEFYISAPEVSPY